MDTLQKLADVLSGGHYTIMRFTTNYRVCLGTPNNYEDVQRMYEGETLEAAVKNMLADLKEVFGVVY